MMRVLCTKFCSWPSPFSSCTIFIRQSQDEAGEKSAAFNQGARHRHAEVAARFGKVIPYFDLHLSSRVQCFPWSWASGVVAPHPPSVVRERLLGGGHCGAAVVGIRGLQQPLTDSNPISATRRG